MKLNVTKAVVLALTSSLILLLAGCANFTSPARKHSLDSGSYWMDYDASRRGMLVLDSPQEGRKWVVCSEPAPDVALNLVNKIEGDLTAGDTDIAGGKAEVTASAIKLAERTQMVSFLRESLFRLCELSLGNEFTADQSKEMYLGNGSAGVADEQARTERATAFRAGPRRVRPHTGTTAQASGPCR